MTKTGRRKSERSTRDKLNSPGRPPVWQRENPCRFRGAVAEGLSSEDGAVEAGVSAPVGTRWFRRSGGMPPTHLAPSAPLPKNPGLSFAEREETALECARGTGVRAIARKLKRSPGTISREIRRNSAARGGDFDHRAINAQWHADRAAKPVKNGPAFAGHGGEAVRDAIAQTISSLPAHLRRSLTRDQGAEMARHAQLRIDTGLGIDFHAPQPPLGRLLCDRLTGSAWQRGSLAAWQQ